MINIEEKRQVADGKEKTSSRKKKGKTNWGKEREERKGREKQKMEEARKTEGEMERERKGTNK